jgi:glutathione-regulated potassium-efflux system ancillary protein KefC
LESNLLLAIFVVLAASVALVPLAKWVGFGTVLGYLAVGVLIGPFGLGLVADGETTLQVAEFGVVMMLFLIGLELQPRELWRMRHRLIGLGVTQVVVTAAALAALLTLFGYAWQVGIIIGLALALSSTAIAMQSVEQRNIMPTDAGRTSLAVLVLQDVAVIPILAAIPILASLVSLEPAAIGEELADILCYAMALASEMDLDIATIMREKMRKNIAKYPAEEFRGRYGQEDPGPNG